MKRIAAIAFAVLLLCLSVRAEQLWIVNYGQTPDTAKVAGDKINTNFLQLYSMLLPTSGGGVSNVFLATSNSIVVTTNAGSGITLWTLSLAPGVMTNAPWSNFLQRASTILTNLSGTGAITNAPWTNFYQPASALLTNWASGNRALTNLSDVGANWGGLADAHVLHYDAASGKWTNGPVAGTGMGAVNELNGLATNLNSYGLTRIAVLSNNTSFGFASGRIQLRTFTNSIVFYDTAAAAPIIRLTNATIVVDQSMMISDQNPSKLLRLNASSQLTSSSYDEGDFASRQGGSAVLTNIVATGAITNASWTNAYQPASALLTNWAAGNRALTNLSDVGAKWGGLANADVLHYDSTSGKWTNGPVAGVGMGAVSEINGKATNLSTYGTTFISTLTNSSLSLVGQTPNRFLRLNSNSGVTNSAYDDGDLAAKQFGNSTLTNLSGLATNELVRYTTATFLTNWANAISNRTIALSNMVDVGGSFAPLQYDALMWDAMLGKWTNSIMLRSADSNFVVTLGRNLSLASDLFIQSSINIDGTNNSSIELQDVTTTNSVKFLATNLMWNSWWLTLPVTNAQGILYNAPTGTNTANLIMLPGLPGESNTMSSVGASNTTSKILFKNKSSVDFPMYSLEQGSNTVLYMTTTSIVVNASSAVTAEISAKATNASDQTIANATPSVVSFTGTVYDTGNIYAGGPGGFTNMPPGRYTFTANITWPSTNSTGVRQAYIKKNGNVIAWTSVQAVNGGSTSFQVVQDEPITSTTDFVQLFVEQSATISIPLVAGNGSPSFSAKLIK